MTDTVVVRSADWLVAYDAARAGHVYLRNADLAFRGDTVTYVGPRYEGEAAREIDARHPAMMPLREPLRSLLFVAAERAVRDVWVDGRQVVKDREVLGIDLESALAALEAAQLRSMERVAGLDWAARSAVELSPMVLDTVDDVARRAFAHKARAGA